MEPVQPCLVPQNFEDAWPVMVPGLGICFVTPDGKEWFPMEGHPGYWSTQRPPGNWLVVPGKSFSYVEPFPTAPFSPQMNVAADTCYPEKGICQTPGCGYSTNPNPKHPVKTPHNFCSECNKKHTPCRDPQCSNPVCPYAHN